MTVVTCRCTAHDSSGCPHPNHNTRVLILRCDSCGREIHADRRRCRCGSLHGAFSRIDVGLQRQLAKRAA